MSGMDMCPTRGWLVTWSCVLSCPPQVRLGPELDKLRKNCLVCQATHPPNWQVAQPIAMTPIPDRVMFSVALDIFPCPRQNGKGWSMTHFYYA